MNKFCNKCGAEISVDSKFCSECGSEIKEVDVVLHSVTNDVESENTKSEKVDDIIGKEMVNDKSIKNNVQHGILYEFIAGAIMVVLISTISGLIFGGIIYIFVKRDFESCFQIPFWCTAILFTIATIGGTIDNKKQIKISNMTPKEKETYYENKKQKEEQAKRNTETYQTLKQSKPQSPKKQYKANKKAGIVSCPKCGSTSITTSNKKISAGKGVAGGVVGNIVMPGVGTVVGAAVGATHSKKIYNVCMNCGHKWKP